MRESFLVIANGDVSSSLATWSLHTPDSLHAGTFNLYRTRDRDKTVFYDTTRYNEEGNDNGLVVMDGASTTPGTGAGMKSRRELIPLLRTKSMAKILLLQPGNWSDRSVNPGCIIVTDTAPSCTSSSSAIESGHRMWLRCRRDSGG